LRLASLDDIAATKLHAIIQSGERVKDFIDMYYLLEHRNLNDLLEAYGTKYPELNVSIARNALLYHKDVNFDWTIEVLRRPFNWREIDERLRMAVQEPRKIFSIESHELKKDSAEKMKKGIRHGR
jgi:hypothetical protein